MRVYSTRRESRELALPYCRYDERPAAGYVSCIGQLKCAENPKPPEITLRATACRLPCYLVAGYTGCGASFHFLLSAALLLLLHCCMLHAVVLTRRRSGEGISSCCDAAQQCGSLLLQ